MIIFISNYSVKTRRTWIYPSHNLDNKNCHAVLGPNVNICYTMWGACPEPLHACPSAPLLQWNPDSASKEKRKRRTLALGHRSFMRALEGCVSGSALVFSASWEAELTQVLQRQSGGWCMNPGSELTPVASHLARTGALTCESRQGSVFWISSYSLRIFSGRKNKGGWSLQVGWRLKKRSERIMLLSVICVSVGGYVCRCTSN